MDGAFPFSNRKTKALRISLIVAMARGRVIGYRGQMPWHLPEDLKRFRRITWGKSILMGRRTFDAIGRPLPGRHNIVLSRTKGLQALGCTVVSSLEEGLMCARGGEVMVIGGASLYGVLLPRARYLHLTRIDADFPGDTRFPEWDPAQWRQIACEERPGGPDFPHSYRFLLLERRG